MIIKPRRSRVLWMFIVSYAVVLLFPLVFSQILFLRSSRVAEESARELSEMTLRRTEENVGRIFTDLTGISRELAARQEAGSLFYAAQPLSPVKLEKVRDLQAELNAKTAHNQYISEIYMYFPASGVMASTMAYQNSREGFGRVLKEQFSTDFETFDQLIHQKNHFQLVLWGGQSKKLVVLSAPYASAGEPGVVCIFTLQTERFRQMLGSYADQNAWSLLWMVSPDGEVFATNGRMRSSADEALDAQALYRLYLDNQTPGGAVLTRTSNVQSGWELFSAVSAEQYSRPLKSIQTAYLIYLAACLTLGLYFSLYFSRRHYRPISRLAQMLKIQTDQSARGEYAALQDALASLIEKERQHAFNRRQQERPARDGALRRILSGRVQSPAQFEKLCAENKLAFSTPRFVCVGIWIRDDNHFLSQSPDGRAELEEEALLHFLITSVLEELLEPVADGYAFAADDALYCLISPRDGEMAADFTQRIKAVCLESGAFIQKHANISLTHYVGALYEDERDLTVALAAAARDAQWGMEQIMGFQLEDSVLDRQSLSEKNSALCEASGEYHNRQLMDRFIRLALDGDSEGAMESYRELRHIGLFPSDHSFFSVQLTSAALLSELIKAAFTPGQQGGMAGEASRWLTALRTAKEMDELETVMTDAVSQVCERLYAADASSERSAAFSAVMAYIAQHYEDPMLSVSSICRHFEVSSSYLLKMFKNHGQNGVLSVIQQHRIDAAKHLLRTTSGSIAQIAQEVGYANALALIRAFKRTEGTTPGNYRISL